MDIVVKQGAEISDQWSGVREKGTGTMDVGNRDEVFEEN